MVELIELLKPAKEFGDAALFESIKAEKKTIKVISERYCEEAEDIGNLSQFYVSSEGSAPPEPVTTPIARSEEPDPVAEPAPVVEEAPETPSPETSEGMSANHDLPAPKTPDLAQETGSDQQGDRPVSSSFSPAT